MSHISSLPYLAARFPLGKVARLFSLAVVLVQTQGITPAAEENWRPLWNGQDLTGWETYLGTVDAAWDVPGLARDATGKYLEPIGKNRDPLHVFTVEKIDGQPALHFSGQGFGVMATKESFSNFHLRFQVKWGEKKWGSKSQAARDSGLLYFCFGEPGAVQKNWHQSVEFQIQEHDMGDLFALGTQITVRARQEGALWLYDPHGPPTAFLQKRPVGNRCVKLGDPEKPHGEWNTLELICLGSDSIHIVNGTAVMRLQAAQRLDGPAPTPLATGQIALQTEGAEVFYRGVEMRPITAVPAAWLEP